ncbi:MAG: alpha/beta hydrolase [Gemmatimonadetes bacterium]|nr:alpha/beta hydrolase [Gemmatimonadota bacterium]
MIAHAVPSLPPQPPAAAWVVTARGDSLRTDTITFAVQGNAMAAHLLTLRVPERRAAGATSRRITVRAVRIAAVRNVASRNAPAPNGSVGAPVVAAPIVFLAGGPGDAGTRALGTMPGPVLDSLRARGDLIALDQRGTGRSEPRLACVLSALDPTLELTRAARDSAAGADATRCVAQLTAAGVDVRGWTTRESAEDIESLRVALGVPRVSLLGGSYGTHLGLAYLAAHPARTARVVLAGVEGPDDTFKRPARVDAVFDAFAALVDADTSRAGRPSIVATVDALRQRVADTPTRVPVGTTTVVVDGSTVQRFITDALGDARAMRQLPAQLDALAAGDLTALARTELRRRQGRPLDAMNLLMNCASGASADRRAQIVREAATSRLGDVIDAPTPAMCDAIAEAVPARAPVLPARMTTAVLFVSGTWDGRTPVANVDALLPRFPNGRHLVYEHLSHGLMGDAEAWQAMLRFLGGLDVASQRVRRPVPAFR